MKVNFVFFLLAGAILVCYGNGSTGGTYASLEEQISSKLEQFRELMGTGAPELGVPVLDPYDLRKFEFAFYEYFISVTGETYDTLISGAQNFEVTSLKAQLLPPQLEYTFTIPDLWIHASIYTMRGKYLGLVPITGHGTMDVRLSNLRISGHMKLGVRDNVPYLRDLLVLLEADRVQTNIEGIQSSKVISVLINRWLSDNGAMLLRKRRDSISKQINDTVLPKLNEKLSKITFDELMDLITGG